MAEKQYIEREVAVEILKEKSLKMFNAYYKGYVNAIRDLIDIPSADVQEVRHGYFRRFTFSGDTIICSECKMAYNIFETNGAENFNFCPHCGAKIDKTE